MESTSWPSLCRSRLASSWVRAIEARSSNCCVTREILVRSSSPRATRFVARHSIAASVMAPPDCEGFLSLCMMRPGLTSAGHPETMPPNKGGPEMAIVGRVDSLWRYPVKSMRGEELEEAFLGFSGIYGDRMFAFKSSGNPKGFPYVTGREQKEM